MVLEYIRYQVPEDKIYEFVNAYRKAQEDLKASPNCLAFECAQCVEEKSLFILRIEWDSMDGHLKEFRSSDYFKRFFEKVKPFFQQIQEMQHYNIVIK